MHPIVDAFWQGRTKFKKTTGRYFDNVKKPKAACALGAIYYGMYRKTTDSGLSPLNEDWPEINGTFVDIPCEHTDGDGKGDVSGILIHLNDEHTGHNWPDTKIAEWLEKALSEINRLQSLPSPE